MRTAIYNFAFPGVGPSAVGNTGPGQVNEAIASGVSPANGYSAKVLGVAQRLNAIDVSAKP